MRSFCGYRAVEIVGRMWYNRAYKLRLPNNLGGNMNKFLPEEYIKEFIPTNKAEKTQMEIFFDFIANHIFKDEEYSVEDLIYLNNNDLLESLKHYIRNNKVTARGTASAYVGYLKNFFTNLKIDSDIFVNGDFLPDFWEDAKKVISLLNEKEDKNIATYEEFKQLEQKIKESEKKYSSKTAMIETDQYFENGCTGRIDSFNLIRSICATQMILEYGFANRTIIEIKIDDIDLDKLIIKRGIYELPIPITILNNLKEYVCIRGYLLSKLKIFQSNLFIKYDGNPIGSSGAADTLFNKVMGEKSSKASTKFANRCIERMINSGLNAELIKEITGYKESVYTTVCTSVNKNNIENIQNKITEFITPSNNSEIRRIGYVDCPRCGKKSIKATSNEFVLIKEPGDDSLYLACKECGEKAKRKNVNET